MKQFRRILAVVLSAAMLLPGTVYATAEEDVYGQSKEAASVAAVSKQQKKSIPREADLDTASLKAQRLSEEFPEFIEDIPQAELDRNAVSAAKKTRVTSLPDADFAQGRLLVKVKRSVSLMDSGGVFDEIAASVDTLFSVTEPARDDGVMLASAEEPTADWFRVELADGVDMLAAWNKLLTEETVLCVQPDYLVQAAAVKEITSYDPYLHSQGWLDQIGAPEAWEQVSNPGKNVVVAVVDSGVDLDHPDLQGRLISGYDFVSYEEGGWDSNPDDSDGHGTHVAGIIAAEKNDKGVRGVAYEAQIMPVRALGDYGGYSSDIATAIRWAAGDSVDGVSSAARRADVINMSFGGFGYNEIEEEAVMFARDQGCLLVAAAGNESLPTTYAGDSYFGTEVSPAGFPGVLSVMAMEQDAQTGGDWLAHFSNYDADPGMGQEFEIMAPGVNIYSTAMGGDYVYMNGTSMACPVVAGAAAVLMGMGCTAAEAWELLVSTAPVKQGKTQPDGTVRSYPALDLEAAVVMKKNGSTAYQKGPSVANTYVMPILSSLDLGHGAVNFVGLGNYHSVYYFRDAFVSQLHLSYENFGGTGTVTFTGTVGGCPIKQVTERVVSGDIRSIELQIFGTPVSNNGYVELDLYANGTRLDLSPMRAVDLKTPSMSGYFTDYGTYYAPNTTNTITLGGSSDRDTVWVLDMTMHLPLNTTVRFMWGEGQENVTVYQDSDAYIDTSYDRTTGEESTLILQNVEACGAGGFYMKGFGDAQFLGSILQDPYAEWVTIVNQCQIYGGWSSMLSGYRFRLSSFVDCYDYTIDCALFENNLVNRCTYSEVIVGGMAWHNTFVENYDPYDGASVLDVYVPDVGTDMGFQSNSVVGPMSICWLNQNEKTDYLATADQVYYQPADDPEMVFTDCLQYDSNSTNISSSLSSLNSWGFAGDSPVFVTGKQVEYDYNSTYGSVDYTITFNLSTAIDEDYWPYVYSYSDPMVNNAVTSVSADGRTVTAEITTIMESPDMVNDYHLAGICTADYITSEYNHYFWATELSGQIVSAPIELESKLLDQVWLSLGSSVTVNWSDSRIRSTDSAVILRSVDGAEPVQIGTVSSATTGTYTDATTEPGHIYEYRVYILRGSNTAYYGSSQFVAAKGTFHGGEDLTATVENSSTFTVGLASPWLAGGGGCLSYTLPEDMAAGIEFSMQVQESGLTLSAVNNGDGTETITIGLPEESAGLAAGELFTITAENGYTFQQVEDDIVARKGGTLLLWHLGNYKAVAAGYQSGKMTGVGVADQWNESCTIQTGNANAWKMFVTNSGWVSAQPALNIV